MQTSFVSDQLELELSSSDDGAAAEASPSPLPHYKIEMTSTPATIVAWWDALVVKIEEARELATSRAKPLHDQISALRGSRTGNARQRIRALRAQCEAVDADAEAVDFEAHALFEAALGEFSPALIRLLQAAGLSIPDDEEMAVAEFWDVLQRPAIEYVGQRPIADLARAYAEEVLAEIRADELEA
jgi:hypothetical protein